MKKLFKNVSLICLCLLLTGCFSSNKKSSEKKSDNRNFVQSKNVIKDQTIDGLKISKVSLMTSDGKSTFEATITNTTDKDVVVDEIQIVLKDKKGNEIIKLPGYIGSTIKPNESRKITSNADTDLSKTDSVTYVVEK